MRLVFDEIVKETEVAWLLKFDTKHVWISRNFNKIDQEENTIDIPKWLAVEKGIEEYEAD